MKRREFITLVGGAAMAPFAARAQHPEKKRRMGVLVGLAASAGDPVADGFLRPFRDAMSRAGWIEGDNIDIDYRFGGPLADLATTNASAAELIALQPDVIYAQGLPATLAVRRQTKTVPVVFTQVADPVGFGLVESLGRPGGNVTGFVVWDLSIGGKWMQYLRELVPDLGHVGILHNPDTTPYAPPLVASIRAAAGTVQVRETHCRNDSDIEAALSSLGQQPHGGLIVIPEPFTNAHRDRIIADCARFRLPAVNPLVGAFERGALLSYTFELDQLIRQPIGYIDRILRGASPKDLPVQAPTKYVLAINLKAAKAIGLEVPPMLLTFADQVIE